MLVVKNYIKHGFKHVIVTDLEDKRITELHHHFKKQNYILFTLAVKDDAILKSRIADKTRSSEYRDYKTALSINQKILDRPLLPHEVRIETAGIPLKEIEKTILEVLK